MKVGVQICLEVSYGIKVEWNVALHSYDIKKDGQYRCYQKYFCKHCERWFNDKTGTTFHYSHLLEEMVLGYLPVICIMAWMFNKRDIIGVSCTLS